MVYSVDVFTSVTTEISQKKKKKKQFQQFYVTTRIISSYKMLAYIQSKHCNTTNCVCNYKLIFGYRLYTNKKILGFISQRRGDAPTAIIN